jgi:hypothetical protein
VEVSKAHKSVKKSIFPHKSVKKSMFPHVLMFLFFHLIPIFLVYYADLVYATTVLDSLPFSATEKREKKMKKNNNRERKSGEKMAFVFSIYVDKKYNHQWNEKCGCENGE